MLYKEKIDALFNKEIILDQVSHTYTLVKNPQLNLTSCTEFVNSFFAPFEKQKIAANLVKTSQKYQDKTVEEVLAEWQASADLGSMVHEEIEKNILHGESVSLEKSEQAISWIKEKLPASRYELLPEVAVCSEALGLAGTIDLLIYDKQKDIYLLIDWKTNKQISKRGFKGRRGIRGPGVQFEDCHYTKYGLQMSLYQYILETEYDIKIRKQALLHLRLNKVQSYACNYLRNEIESMLVFDQRL